MHFCKVQTDNDVLGLILSESMDSMLYYTITNVHKSQINVYHKDIIGSYLLFLNGYSLYNKSKEYIREIKKKNKTCTFYFSKDKSEVLKLKNYWNSILKGSSSSSSSFKSKLF